MLIELLSIGLEHHSAMPIADHVLNYSFGFIQGYLGGCHIYTAKRLH